MLGGGGGCGGRKSPFENEKYTKIKTKLIHKK